MNEHHRLRNLVGRVAVGEQDALGALYDVTAPTILGALTARIDDSRLAERLTSDTFLQVWRRASQFDGNPGDVMTWMFSIAADLVERASPELHTETA